MEPAARIEPARLLHARSEHGYTHEPALALRDEPEAVPEETQRELTAEAHRRAELRRRRDWERLGPRLWAIVVELEHALGREFGGEVRALARGAERLDRRIAGRAETRPGRAAMHSGGAGRVDR